MSQANSGTHDANISVFEHAKRREWGLSLLAWESKGKRGYVFENGQLRVLAEPFFALMLPVACPLDEAQALAKCLKPEIDAARAEQGPTARLSRSGPSGRSVQDQITVFRAEYPAGFADPRWIEKFRHAEGKKGTRTHRDPVIAEAAEKLGLQSLGSRLRDQSFRAIHEDLIALIQKSDLVPANELGLIATSDPERQRSIALMVGELLHGKAEFASRFGHFLAAVQQATGKPAGWQLATIFSSLLLPREHVCVRPTSFRAQAKSAASALTIPKLPNAAVYARCLGMVKLVSIKLNELGEAPQDLMDVTDFMQFSTQSPKRGRPVTRQA